MDKGIALVAVIDQVVQYGDETVRVHPDFLQLGVEGFGMLPESVIPSGDVSFQPLQFGTFYLKIIRVDIFRRIFDIEHFQNVIKDILTVITVQSRISVLDLPYSGHM